MVSFAPWKAITCFFQNKFSSTHVSGITVHFLHTYLSQNTQNWAAMNILKLISAKHLNRALNWGTSLVTPVNKLLICLKFNRYLNTLLDRDLPDSFIC